MDQPFIPITDNAAMEHWFVRSHQAPVLVFKHDPACSVSAGAYRELSQVPGEVPLVDVAHAHELSQAIALRTSVEHASPQAILLRDGQAVWSASKREITYAAVQDALQDLDPHM